MEATGSCRVYVCCHISSDPSRRQRVPLVSGPLYDDIAPWSRSCHNRQNIRHRQINFGRRGSGWWQSAERAQVVARLIEIRQPEKTTAGQLQGVTIQQSHAVGHSTGVTWSLVTAEGATFWDVVFGI